MGILDSIDNIFKNIYDFSGYSRALVIFATAVGLLALLFFALRLVYNLLQVFRLYVCSQYCCKKDLIENYGRWAVVSGATDGIGQSMAKELAGRGMSVIVIGRNQEKLDNTKAMLEKIPNAGQIETVKIDLSDPSAANFDRIKHQIDPENRDIGILINNAGTFPARFARFNNFDIDFMVNLVNLNISATLHLTRMIMPGMVQRGKGLVLNVSSSLGSMPTPYFSVYGPSKAFIDSFTRQLQMEYSSHPLDIVLLTPGPVQTKLLTATSKTTSSLFIPSSDDFARSALNALSANISIFSGVMSHGLMKESGQWFDSLGLLNLGFKLNLKMNAVDYQLSPVPRRKKLASGANQEGVSLSDRGATS